MCINFVYIKSNPAESGIVSENKISELGELWGLVALALGSCTSAPGFLVGCFQPLGPYKVGWACEVCVQWRVELNSRTAFYKPQAGH